MRRPHAEREIYFEELRFLKRLLWEKHMSAVTVMLLTFFAGVMAVAGIYSVVSDVFLKDRARLSQRVDEEFRQQQRGLVKKSSLFKDLGKLASQAAEDEDVKNWRMEFATMFDQSGLTVEPSRFVSISAGIGVVLGVGVGIAMGSILFGIAVAPACVGLPLLYVRHLRNKRQYKLLSQLPDAFDLMSRVMRAGQTMSQSLLSVADEFDQPLSAEFSYCYEQQRLGLSPDLAMRDLARRSGLLEMRIFVLAVLVQRQTGGNLAELLDGLANVVRERFRIRGKIQVLTAEGRIQAVVLLALPPILWVVIWLLNRTYAETLLEHPRLILAGLAMMGVGYLWIRKIINFEI